MGCSAAGSSMLSCLEVLSRNMQHNAPASHSSCRLECHNIHPPRCPGKDLLRVVAHTFCGTPTCGLLTAPRPAVHSSGSTSVPRREQDRIHLHLQQHAVHLHPGFGSLQGSRRVPGHLPQSGACTAGSMHGGHGLQSLPRRCASSTGNDKRLLMTKTADSLSALEAHGPAGPQSAAVHDGCHAADRQRAQRCPAGGAS